MYVLSVVISKLSEQRLAKLGYHGRIVCEVCGHEDRVHVAHCFRNGFPQHCGQTMVLHKEKQDEENDQ